MSQPALTLFTQIRSQIRRTLNQPLKNSPTFNRGWAYLASLLVVAVLCTLWINANQVEAHTLFQSPQSPPPPAEALPPPEQPPAAPPPAEQPPAAAPPVEQPQVAQPTPVQPAIEAAPPPVQQNPAPAAPDQPEERTSRRDRDNTPPNEAESGSKTGFSFDQAEFIDTAVVSGAYIWLCCGVILLLLTPLGLLFLYIQGRSKIIKEERY
jgi:hypothetical protein